jgi:hypothetical protein
MDREDLNWPRRDFDPDRLRLVTVSPGTERRGTTYSTYRHPDGWTREDWLWREGESAPVDRDWARYVVLADRQRRIIAYDERRRIVSTPRQVPLPKLAARLLALCSGSPPVARTGEGLGTWMYKDVPSSIFEIVASKLGQDGRKLEMVSA